MTCHSVQMMFNCAHSDKIAIFQFSIMRTIGSTNAIPMLANGQNAVLPPTGQIGELNLITPASSMNVTPTETEVSLFAIFFLTFDSILHTVQLHLRHSIY